MTSSSLCTLLGLLALTTRVSVANQLRSSDGRIESSHEEQPVKESHSRHRNLLACLNPLSITFAAKTHLMTFKKITCTDAESQYIGERINYHWNKYPAWSSVYGPVSLTSTGTICHSSRRLLSDETHYDSHHRGDKWKMKTWSYYASNGKCTLCLPGSKDRRLGQPSMDADVDRRQLSATVPVTFVFDTDEHPDEMWFKVKDSAGRSIITQKDLVGAQVRSSYTVTYNLIPGMTYTFIMKDNYGDGWCCSSGYGGVKIYDGIPAVGMDLIDHFVGDFAYHRVREFTVPTLGVTARSAGYANPADVLFPELETGLGNWISFYLQQEFGTTGCLKNSYPSVWIDLESVPANYPPAC